MASARRLTMARSQPSRASASAAAWPSQRLAAMTTATVPVKP
jgi:hypothetical protein